MIHLTELSLIQDSLRHAILLTLLLPTSHMCVENTVLAFMICLLFNLSYKVTITCKWNQLVYFAIITADKPNQPPDFHCISPVRFDNKAQSAKFSAKEQHQILHNIYRQFLIKIFVQK